MRPSLKKENKTSLLKAVWYGYLEALLEWPERVQPGVLLLLRLLKLSDLEIPVEHVPACSLAFRPYTKDVDLIMSE